MGHQIAFKNFPIEMSIEDITKTVLQIVRTSGDRYGTERLQYVGNTIFPSYEAACEWTEKQSGYYVGFIVKFHNCDRMTPSEKMLTIKEQMKENRAKAGQYAKDHSVKNLKAAFIGCPCCGSKLKRERLNRETCPLCWTDLRSESVKKRLLAFDEKYRELEKKYREAYEQNGHNAPLQYLAKFEYHV